MEVERETFKGADNSTQNLLLFDSIKSLCEKVDSFSAGCSAKHEKVDAAIVRSGRINKSVSAGSGLLGGFLAFFASKVFGG